MGWLGGYGDKGASGEPLAGVEEVLVEEAHDEVDGAAVGVADEAAEGVAAAMEGEGGVAVVVEGAEGLVVDDLEAEALGDFLDGEGAEEGYLFLGHFSFSLSL